MAEPVTPTNRTENYQPIPGVFDELRDSAGLRPHWRNFIAAFNTLGAEEWSRRWDQARRMIREHGVTYHVQGEPTGLDRPWELDPVPLVLPPEDWQVISAGVAQRARLLNALLADAYGPQRLWRERILPPALLFANPNFWRPLHGIAVPHGLHLHLYGTDLTRSPAGHWWVMADRTQIAAGNGYALENRMVLARCLPELFRQCGVRRIADSFDAVRDLLANLSPRAVDNPRVVLLTPGPRTHTYFEHAYLARHLGCTLAEGNDLTVRENRVYFKTLEGLHPVDVILRRLDDALCDPLDLDGESLVGVAGLVQAVRAGNVTVANALGSSLVQAPAFFGFLPGICRVMLGEELQLPSVATWWCGEPAALQYVLAHLKDLVIKPAFNPRLADPIFGHALTADQLKNLAARLTAQPADFVAQEVVPLAHAPVDGPRGLQPRPVLLRTFAVAQRAGGYRLMPGGLTRVLTAAGTGGSGLMFAADGSKDTWVLGDDQIVEPALLAATDHAPGLNRGTTELSSRTADDLYWLGRYAERAEGIARLVRCVLGRLGTEAASPRTTELATLLQIMDSLGLITMDFGFRSKDGPGRALEIELFSLLYKAQRTGSLQETLNRLHRLAKQVRDRLSTDTWRILNQLHQSLLRSAPGRRQSGETQVVLNDVIALLAAFSGMEMENMTRGHGWRFLEMGRRLERAVQLLGLLRPVLAEAGADENAPVLEIVLEIADSAMTYRSRYYTSLALGPVLDLVLADESNPRSVAFQVAALRQHVRRLPRGPHAPKPTREDQITDELTNLLSQEAIQTHCQQHLNGEPKPLQALLSRLLAQLFALSETLMHYYFSHAARPRQLAGP